MSINVLFNRFVKGEVGLTSERYISIYERLVFLYELSKSIHKRKQEKAVK